MCGQVVNLDPVIEDDAELQKSSKVRNASSVCVEAVQRVVINVFEAQSELSEPQTDLISIICVLLFYPLYFPSLRLVSARPAAARPHAASRRGAGLVRWSPLHLLCGPWRPRGETWSLETRG